jgi:DNA-binding MarR family transcriptional regulator
VGTATATPQRKPAAAPARDSPADQAWALLRELLFAERRRFAEAASAFELHPAQAGALMHLDEESGLPMHEIAARLACDSSNVTGIVDRLQVRGLVTRRASEQDRRVKYIVPTPLGVEVRDAMRERMARPPAGIERLSIGEQRQLRDLLGRAASSRAPA